MSLYQETLKYVKDVFAKANKLSDISHAERTAYWVRELKPDADEALLIAAVSHDIERAFYGDWKAGSSDEDKLKKHQELSVAEIEKFLKSKKADSVLIERVKYLVLKHESGGDADQNILCDADCLAWFEEKAVRRVKEGKAKGKSVDNIQAMLDYVYSRINSDKAKVLAKKWYDAALAELRKV